MIFYKSLVIVICNVWITFYYTLLRILLFISLTISSSYNILSTVFYIIYDYSYYDNLVFFISLLVFFNYVYYDFKPYKSIFILLFIYPIFYCSFRLYLFFIYYFLLSIILLLFFVSWWTIWEWTWFLIYKYNIYMYIRY